MKIFTEKIPCLQLPLKPKKVNFKLINKTVTRNIISVGRFFMPSYSKTLQGFGYMTEISTEYTYTLKCLIYINEINMPKIQIKFSKNLDN